MKTNNCKKSGSSNLQTAAITTSTNYRIIYETLFYRLKSKKVLSVHVKQKLNELFLGNELIFVGNVKGILERSIELEFKPSYVEKIINYLFQ
ncbi:MAG TPA: hypothetical protein PKY82_00800 [Pyrinomonadaceae bacterium]|nr:hypothetical protein [Pyrinomonadaceae bacterium]